MSQPHLLLVDASGFAHRAYHVGANRFRSDGLPTWAIEGYMGMLWRLLGAAQHDQPTHAAAVFDAPGKTFRHKIFPDYKNNRPARDEELAVQLPYMRNASEAMGITPAEMEGYEADDVIATLAWRAVKDDFRVTIVSSDKDFTQLIRAGKIEIVDPMAHVRITEDDANSWRFAVPPARVPDYQALVGDSVDNIPGLEGVGGKTGSHLIRRFRTIEGVVRGAREDPQQFTPGVRARLKQDGILEELRLYRRLATLRRNVPIQTSWGLMALLPIMREHIDLLLQKLEASGRFEAIFQGTPQMQRVVAPIEDELEWWREELLIPDQPVPDIPQCGCYERRLAKGGVFVPALIWRDPELDPVTQLPTGQQILRCQVGETPADPIHEWPRLARHPIAKSKFDFEMADRSWARLNAPDDPKNSPHKSIDFSTLEPPRFQQPDSKKRKKA